MKRILICEDEAAIRSFVVINLRHAGFEVYEAESGEQALDIFSRELDIDVVLLDVMLPGIDGFEVCRRLRLQDRRVGIIMLTALTRESERINGLTLGADDYVSKPFSSAELMARIEALCRRIDLGSVSDGYRETLSSGVFMLNMRSRTLHRGEQVTELTQVEFQMMEYFFMHEGEPLSRGDILARVWGKLYVGDEKIVDVNIRRMRMKVEDDPSDPRHIRTVRGQGYCWCAE